MEMLGTVPYVTLEQGVEKYWEALFVYEVEGKLFFKNNTYLPGDIKRQLPNLANSMQKIVEQPYQAYQPLFERNHFERMTAEVVCQRTFFERRDVFAKKHPKYKNTLGLFYSEAGRDYQYIKPGSYIRIDERSNLNTRLAPELEVTIFHEYGHEMHYQTCQAGISWFKYDKYSYWISEVIATHAERRIKKGYELKKHLKILRKLEKIPPFISLPFHQQVEKLLEFTRRKELIKYIEKNL